MIKKLLTIARLSAAEPQQILVLNRDGLQRGNDETQYRALIFPNKKAATYWIDQNVAKNKQGELDLYAYQGRPTVLKAEEVLITDGN